MSEPVHREADVRLLASGVAAALRYMTTVGRVRSSDCILNSLIMDERRAPLGGDPLCFFSGRPSAFRSAPSVAFRSFVHDMCTGFELTAEELVTAYYHFENVIRKSNVKAVPFYVMRPLFASCVALVVKTLDDSALTIVDISEVFIERGYRVDPARVGKMERALLEALDFDINSFGIYDYDSYTRALVNEAIALQPTAPSEAG